MGDFRKLAVWKRAHGVALAVYRVTGRFPGTQRFTLTSRLQRAAVSICSNIAEGCGRQGDAELRRFLRIARGSANELECQLLLAKDLGCLETDEWQTLNRDVRSLSRLLFRLSDALSP